MGLCMMGGRHSKIIVPMSQIVSSHMLIDLLKKNNLLNGAGKKLESAEGVMFQAIVQDTRSIQKKPMALFACRVINEKCTLLCQKAHGEGVAGIIKEGPLPDGAAYGDICLHVTDIKAAIGLLYPLFYPRLPRYKTAITGTDGKTSVMHLTYQLLKACHTPVCCVGTLGVQSWPQICSDFVMPPEITTLTTPTSDDMYTLSTFCNDNAMDHFVWEYSSHALHQDRVYPLRADIGIFTSFSQDHLDYHKTMGAYWDAKMRLLTENVMHGALLSTSLPQQDALMSACKHLDMFWYGKKNSGHMGQSLASFYEILSYGSDGIKVNLSILGKTWVGFLPVWGEFQISNILAALTALAFHGVDVQDCFNYLTLLHAVPGRMEHVGTVNHATIIVDYAHTPRALDYVISALKSQALGAVGVIFGCGGDRDQGKRQAMGEVVQRLADWAIITDDNPRSESPEIIRNEIAKGCPGAKIIGSRKAAIAYGIACLNPGDILLVAGKGAEKVQRYGDSIQDCCDADIIHGCIKATEGIEDRAE